MVGKGCVAARHGIYYEVRRGCQACAGIPGQLSSVAEQQFCKLRVVGSTPTAGSIFLPDGQKNNEAVRLRFIFCGLPQNASCAEGVLHALRSRKALHLPHFLALPDDEALSLRANMKRSAFASHEAFSLRRAR